MKKNLKEFYMAYISCPSCHKTVSSKASVCPYCGAKPISPEEKTPTIEFEEPKTAEERTAEVRTKKKKTAPATTTPKKAKTKKKIELPDKTVSNTVKRMIFQTIVSFIGYGIAFLLGGLVIDILEGLFAPALVLSTLKHTRAFLTGSALLVGIFAGSAGPIARGQYIPKEDAKKIVRAKALPLQWLSLVYLLPAIAAAIFYIISREKLMHVVESNVGTDKEILTLAISFSVCIYYAVFTLGSFIHVMMSRCPKCHHIDCKVKYGESDHTFESETVTRERTVAGSSYDVYTSSGTHVGTISGPDSTVTQQREITTEKWSVYWRCIHCGCSGSTKEDSVTKSSWK